MTTYYIALTGNDSTGDGSNGNPWRTPEPFHNIAVEGQDSLILKNGTWDYNDTASFPAGNQFQFGFTYQGESRSGCVLSDDGSNWTNEQFGADGKTTIVKDMTLMGIVKTTNENIAGATLAGTVIFDSIQFNDIDVSNGTSSNAPFMGRDGTGVSNASFDVTFQFCEFYNIFKTTTNGFVFGHRRASDASNDSTIRFVNSTYHCDQTGAAVPLAVILTGISISTYYHYYARNMIFFNDSGATYTLIETASEISQDDDYSDYYLMTNPPTLGGNSITSDPLFMDSSSNNYNLRPTSPCINAGTAVV
ncbi:hypothetical protein HED60_13820 [Planctomycetales bacterium ZRK34]|nr:hypothetical protein HED60_13820 [Planctomycetales bacterium ZRK34]